MHRVVPAMNAILCYSTALFEWEKKSWKSRQLNASKKGRIQKKFKRQHQVNCELCLSHSGESMDVDTLWSVNNGALES